MQRIAVRQTADVLKAGELAFESETDLTLAEDALPSNLKMMETFLEVDPGNPELLFLLAKGYASYALLFMEDGVEVAALDGDYARRDALQARARGMYLRARDYALALVPDLPGLAKAVRSGAEADLRTALKDAGPGDVEPLFWMGYAWGGYINVSKDDPAAVAKAPAVKAVMERLVELDERYFYAGPHQVLAALAASLPPALGGQPDVARAHFDKALGFTEGQFLLVQYMMARLHAVQIQDVALFRQLMGQILDAPADLHRPANLPNAVMKRRARRWLDHIDVLFPDATPSDGAGDRPAGEETPDDDAPSDF